MVLAGVLLAAGCGSGDGDGDWLKGLRSPEATPSSEEPAPSPSTTPPLTGTEYQELLRTTVAPLNSALSTLRKGGSDKAVDSALTAAADAAAESHRLLDEADVPAEITTQHDAYVTALNDLAADLGSTQQGRGDGTFCTGAAANAHLGSGTSLKAALDTARALGDSGYDAGLAVSAFPKEANHRLSSGKFVKDGKRNGRGVLKITGGDEDAVVTLARGGKAVFSVYVRKNGKAQVKSISDGSYAIYFTSGTDWNAKARKFNRGCTYEKFEKKAKFTTKTTSTQITYTIFTIGLKTTLGGNSPVNPIEPGELPK